MSENDTDERMTQSLGDQLGMDFGFDPEAWAEEIGFDADEEVWREYDGRERTIIFDLLWEATGTYPPELDSGVVDALLDDEDHRYAIDFDGQDETREVSASGIALFAYTDADASVGVVS